MKRRSVLCLLSVVGLLVVALSGGPRLYAEGKASGDIPEDVRKSSVSMPVLRGDLWQTMTNDEKVSFIWGAGHVISIEIDLMSQIPELKRDSFVMKANEGLAGVSMQETVNKIDSYYSANPDKLSMPVFDVIWEILIKPSIKTGIVGRPLR